jgi:hypothetical protein
MNFPITACILMPPTPLMELQRYPLLSRNHSEVKYEGIKSHSWRGHFSSHDEPRTQNPEDTRMHQAFKSMNFPMQKWSLPKIHNSAPNLIEYTIRYQQGRLLMVSKSSGPESSGPKSMCGGRGRTSSHI